MTGKIYVDFVFVLNERFDLEFCSGAARRAAP